MMKNLFKRSAVLWLVVVLFGINSTCNPIEQYVKIDRKTILTELEIGKFLQTWDRTKTIKGGFSLQLLLMNPLNDKKMLSDRQHFIKKLVSDTDVFERLQKALSDLAESEHVIFQYLHQEESRLFDVLNGVYNNIIGIRSLTNLNAVTQEGWFVFKVVTSFWQLFTAVGGRQFAEELSRKVWLPNYTMNFKNFTSGALGELVKQHSLKRNIGANGSLFSLQNAPQTFWARYKHKLFGPAGLPLSPEDAMYACWKGYARDVFDYLRQDQPPVYKESKSWLGYFVWGSWHLIRKGLYYANRTPVGVATSFFSSLIPTIVYDASYIYALDNSQRAFRSNIQVIAVMQRHCCMVSKYLKAVRTILEIQKEHDLFTYILPNISSVLSSEHFDEITSIFNTSTFESPSKFLFYHGRVMHAHKLLKEHSDLLTPLTEYIGELDAYMSVAQMYRECQDSHHQFSFVNYIDTDDGAIIDAKDAWHPLLFGKSIKQDVHLGVSSDTQHMVITGPNWSGKSIYLKTIGLIAYLGQTLTMAPASSCSMTLFDTIGTCLDPVGDVTKGLSKFAMQKENLENFKNVIAESNGSNKSLLLVDEILSGTVDDMIGQRTIEFGTSISSTKNAILLITTHVFEPTNLEGLTNGLFKNFHVEIIPQDDESFIRTFHVVQGPATWWFDPQTKLLRSKFIDWINEELKKTKREIITQ